MNQDSEIILEQFFDGLIDKETAKQMVSKVLQELKSGEKEADA